MVVIVGPEVRGFQIAAFLLSAEVEGGVEREGISLLSLVGSLSSFSSPDSEDLLSTLTASLVDWMMDDLAWTLHSSEISAASLRCLTTETGVPLSGWGTSSNARSLFLGVTMKGVLVDSCLFSFFGELDSLIMGVAVLFGGSLVLRSSSLSSFLILWLPITGLGGNENMLDRSVAEVGEVVAVVVVVVAVVVDVVVSVMVVVTEVVVMAVKVGVTEITATYMA